jgi:hypothetical protein
MKTKKTKRRALYIYTCATCGKKRSSLIYVRATGEVCSICRKNQVPENQPSLFSQSENDKEVAEVLDLINSHLTEPRQKDNIKPKVEKHNKPKTKTL